MEQHGEWSVGIAGSGSESLASCLSCQCLHLYNPVPSSLTWRRNTDLPGLLSTEVVKRKCPAHSRSLIKVTTSRYSGDGCHFWSQLHVPGTVLSAWHLGTQYLQ